MRLIDADKVEFKLCTPIEDENGIFRGFKSVSIVANETTIDAVPVIRCKDCKHWQCDDSESYCDELGIFNTDPTSYCSYAKRKEE